MKYFTILFLLIIGTAYADLHHSGERVMAHWKKGQFYQEQGQFTEAVSEYTNAIEIEESYRGVRQYDIYNDRGVANFLQGKYAEALSDFEIVINRASFSHSLGKLNIARTLKRRAETYTALCLYENAAEDLASLARIQDFAERMDQFVKKSPSCSSSMYNGSTTLNSFVGMQGNYFSFAQVSTPSPFTFARESYCDGTSGLPELILVKRSQKSIDNKRQDVQKKLKDANQHAYDIGREAMNGKYGESAHHLIQAGVCLIDAWEYSREANRMEQENRTEQKR
jgi:tetratricopeptide (TPR) repeat protein